MSPKRQRQGVFILAFFLFSGAVMASHVLSHIVNPETESFKKRKMFAYPPKYAKHFSFGYEEAIADGLWLRLIQDFDRCVQSKSSSDVSKESSTGDTKKRDGRLSEQLDKKTEDNGVENSKIVEEELAIVRETIKLSSSNKSCDASWTFYMLDTITELAPRFRMAYATGGITLSVLLEDTPGAKKIFDKAVKNFPNDWPILYRAAYSAIFDQGDYKTGARLLVQASKAGAPQWVESLAARLFTKSGQIEMAIITLTQYRDSIQNEEARKAVDERIDRLKVLR